MAFTFSVANNSFDEEVYGLLGLKPDDPLMPLEVVSDNVVVIGITELKVNEVVTNFDTMTQEEKDTVYLGALNILAGYLYKFYMPNAIPKYASSHKTVFDRFKTVDFEKIGNELLGLGTSILYNLTGNDFSVATGALLSPPGTDYITG